MAAVGHTTDENSRERAWADVNRILASHASEGNFKAFDEFTKAWNAWSTPEKTPPFEFEIDGKMTFWPIGGNSSAKPRKTTALDIIAAIESLQNERDRAPTRTEVMELVNKWRKARWHRKRRKVPLHSLTPREMLKQLEGLELVDRIGKRGDGKLPS